ncbi:MAG TPA: hypothetical protein VFH39_00500, partial [Candidatus Saccharimonadales bacterium]|nr:hypothetical protein [Candidatus Saccharimonadales bacterium]
MIVNKQVMKIVHHVNRNAKAYLMVALVFGTAGTLLLGGSHALTPTANIEAEAGTATGATAVSDSSASGGSAIRFHQTCTVSATLVNSCRPWLGAAANNYPGITGLANRIADHESRIGRQLDIVHDYLNPGAVLSSDDVTLATRANTILLVNWKPSLTWSTAGGSDSTVNTQIDNMANSIKALGSTKVMLTIFHEPENDVSTGGDPNCTSITYQGSAGTVTDYVNMWHNVRSRFDADGVTNVVWVMNYMGYPTWNCLVPDLWPGNSYVDWIMWDPYSQSSDFSGMVNTFYSYLTTNSDSTHDYTSKPWGLAEWGN